MKSYDFFFLFFFSNPIFKKIELNAFHSPCFSYQLCVQFEEELESEKALRAAQVKKKKNMGLKQLVKSCAKGSKTKEI